MPSFTAEQTTEPTNPEPEIKFDVQPFFDFDLVEFWGPAKHTTPTPFSEDVLTQFRKEKPQFHLPDSYLAFLRVRNGGYCTKDMVPTDDPECPIGVESFFPIENLIGDNTDWIDEWGYPSEYLYIADTPSGGHDMIALDYSVDPLEPRVVNIDQEMEYRVLVVADCFEEFIKKMKTSEELGF
ncbi:hypothetical protein PCE1_004245 [Barthelona sp. PCE]